MSDTKTAPSREFLERAAGAAGVLILKPQAVFGSQADSTVEVGLVGCGNRGTWIAPFSRSSPAHASWRWPMWFKRSSTPQSRSWGSTPRAAISGRKPIVNSRSPRLTRW